MVALKMAFGTTLDMSAHHGGAAVHDAPGSLVDVGRQSMSGRICGKAKDKYGLQGCFHPLLPWESVLHRLVAEQDDYNQAWRQFGEQRKRGWLQQMEGGYAAWSLRARSRWQARLKAKGVTARAQLLRLAFVWSLGH